MKKRLTQEEFLAKIDDFNSLEKVLTGALFVLQEDRCKLTEAQKIPRRKKRK